MDPLKSIRAFQSRAIVVDSHPWGFEATFVSPTSKAVLGFAFEWVLQPLGNRSAQYSIRYCNLTDKGFQVASAQIYQSMLRHIHQDGLSVIYGQKYDDETRDQRTIFEIFGSDTVNVPAEKDDIVRMFGAYLVRALDHCGYIDPRIKAGLDIAIMDFKFSGYCPQRPEQRILVKPTVRRSAPKS